MLHHALRAGISERDFWSMTAFSVSMAFGASQENLSRLAYRTAYYQRVQVKHFPKTEDSIFKMTKPKQSLREQFAMAKLVTSLSKEVH